MCDVSSLLLSHVSRKGGKYGLSAEEKEAAAHARSVSEDEEPEPSVFGCRTEKEKTCQLLLVKVATSAE